jgi:hypothetical protein
MSFLNNTRRFVSEMAHGGWVIILLYASLALSRVIVVHFYGNGWGFVTAVIALTVWLSIRPWRLGLLSKDSRREVFVLGTFWFVAWVLLSALAYWKI